MSTTEQILATSSEPEKHACEWEGCKGNPHPKKIVYENKGKGSTDRGSYIGNWPKPFHIGTPSYTDFGIKDGHFKKLVSSKYSLIVESSESNYFTVNHHVIPVDVMTDKAALAKNLKLVGWNINDGISNGICLPYFREDQIWHCLQPHRGSHPGAYITDVNTYLKPLETLCKKFCLESEDEKSKNDQATLLEKISQNVETIRNRILNWKTKIHLSETLDNWESQVINRSISRIGYYYKHGDTQPSPAPKVDKSSLGSRKYIE